MFGRSLTIELLIQRANRFVAKTKGVLHHHGVDRTVTQSFHVGLAEIKGDEFDFAGEIADGQAAVGEDQVAKDVVEGKAVGSGVGEDGKFDAFESGLDAETLAFAQRREALAD